MKIPNGTIIQSLAEDSTLEKVVYSRKFESFRLAYKFGCLFYIESVLLNGL